MIGIKDIQSEYKRAILESQKLYADRRDKDTAGAVRYTKGKIVEDITKDIRDINKPLHKPEYFKPLTSIRFIYGIEQFRKILLLRESPKRRN